MSTGSGLKGRQVESGGFSLLGLLLSMTIGLSLCGLMIQLLQRDGRLSGALAQRMTERAAQRRTLELLRSEVQRAERVRTEGASASQCGLAGRRLALELETEEGPITYTVGRAPSAIWRGQVLMRCGPAYGLHGEPSTGSAQNRVVIDGLPTDGLTDGLQVEALGNGLLRVRLRQQGAAGGDDRRIESQLTVAGRHVDG